MSKKLIYTLKEFNVSKNFIVTMIVDIIDEYTLQFMEKRYPGKLTFDGGRIFTLNCTTEMRGMAESNPLLWDNLKKKNPEIVNKFVLERLKGNI